LPGEPPIECLVEPFQEFAKLAAFRQDFAHRLGGGHAPLGEFEWADSYFALWRTILAASIPAGIIGLLILLKRTKA